jgi:predicted dehydrogenase
LTTRRIGLIGAGHISWYHLQAWAKVADAQVVAVCDIDPARAASRAAEFGIDGVFGDAAEMLDAVPLDAVDIATWRATHADLIRLAAAHGLGVLCQKPLAPTLDEAAGVAAEVDGRIRLMVHENRRFAPHFRQIRAWVDDGRIGAVRQVVMTRNRTSHMKAADGTRPSVARAAHFGFEERLLIAGALTHQIDVLRYLLGPLSMVAARSLYTEPDLPGETVATLLLETADGAPVVIAGNAVAPGFADSPSPVGANAGEVSGERLVIAGSVGTVVMDEGVLELRGDRPERVTIDPLTSYQACFDGAIAHFIACLDSGRPFDTAPDDNLLTLALVEDAYRLARPRPEPVGTPTRRP